MAVFVIAEVGVNHGGDPERAQRLIDVAKEAGADAVKFQMFSSRALWGDDRIKHLELSRDELARLHRYCEQVGIEFMCTPFDVGAVKFLTPLVRRMKVASGCIGRGELLGAVRATGLPAILSTGMSENTDIASALSCLGPDVTLLHCTSSYPCRIEDVNLRAMDTLREEFRHAVGYSDHTPGITIAIAAAAKGATVIEKHLTLDRGAEGPDHKASIEPVDFRVMVSAIRTVETALGDGVKAVRDCEVALRRAWHEPAPPYSPA